MTLLILYLFIAIFFSFLCSILEAVLLSITPSYVGAKKKEGLSYAADLERLKNDIDRPLAAILTLNTFAHTIGAAGVGAQAQSIWGDEYLSLISAVLTILILVFSEIIPKTLGATFWRQLARPSTAVVKVLVVVLFPFVWISQIITKIIKGKNYQAGKVTRADFSAMAEISSKEGALQEGEYRYIRNILQFRQVKIQDIMTPRNVMMAFPEDMPLTDVAQQLSEKSFSRLPVYQGSVDHVTGMVLKDEVLKKLADDEHHLSLSDLRRDVLRVQEEQSVTELFRAFTESKEHIAIAMEEHGGTAGVITMEDVIETLLGMEIVDEMDTVPDMRAYAQERSQARSTVSSKEKASE
ncbi:MAG: CNNM domain-containing protein [Tunicatimonas sp.]